MIIIDNREHHLINLLEDNEITIEKKNLDLGDIIIIKENYKILIERKTISDLCSSIKDGRYKEQKIRFNKLL